MIKNYMVWFPPTVVALLATGISGVSADQAADSPQAKTTWNINVDQSDQNPVSHHQLIEDDKHLIETQQTNPEADTVEQSSTDVDQVVDTALAAETTQTTDTAQAVDPSKSVHKEPTAAEKQQLDYDLEQQYLQLRASLETEDSFSPKLGEDYYGYGMLLRAAGRYDEAIEAFTDSLHIEKINHGIYALEQRPSLKALFELHYALDKNEDYEDYIERILWIESKNPQVNDILSFKLLIMLGNHYIDQFLIHPMDGQFSLQTLGRAKQHLLDAIRRHGDKSINEYLMPYGELALISFLESRMQPEVVGNVLLEDPRLRRSINLDGREPAFWSYYLDSYPRGEAYLLGYLKKANDEKNPRHAVRALISLGDFNQLFNHNDKAAAYYFQAGEAARSSGQEDILLSSFSKPVSLPDFQYSVFRQPILPTRPSILVPLSLEVDKNGRVKGITQLPPEHEHQKYFSKAQRAARRLIFRPKMVDGKAVAASRVQHQIRIYVSK